MAAVRVYVLLFTAFFFSGLMQMSMAQQDKPAAAAARRAGDRSGDRVPAHVRGTVRHLFRELMTDSSNFVSSVRSAYILGFNQKFGEVEEACSSRPMWKKLWSANVPPKVKHFVWKAATNSLATKLLKKKTPGSYCAKMAAVKAYVLLFTAFFSGLMQLSMAKDKPTAAVARVIDAQAIDQAIAYLLMFVALFVTYFAS
ncbi:hypothetical protein EJB05_54055, partial [Eragrostis curvula]